VILIVVRHKVRPEHASDWATIVAPFTSATRAEPGNISFEWSRSVDDPDVYLLVEAFKDSDAGAAHVSSDHFKAAVAQMPELLAARPELVYADIPVEDWTPMAEFEIREP
jgi:quinol monooxygenase YgiN